MRLAPYIEQVARWPQQGRHILARFDDEHVVVYQAFRPAIAEVAVRRGRFEPPFSLARMSWVKPNFLWMMYRCGWAQKQDQERVLAVWLPRAFFERLLAAAVASCHDPACMSHEQWRAAVARSDVRLQWDPDHDPTGRPVARRALQLGLRGAMLEQYALHAAARIEDVTPFVSAQRVHAEPPFHRLQLPYEQVYVPRDPAAARAVGLDPE